MASAIKLAKKLPMHNFPTNGGGCITPPQKSTISVSKNETSFIIAPLLPFIPSLYKFLNLPVNLPEGNATPPPKKKMRDSQVLFPQVKYYMDLVLRLRYVLLINLFLWHQESKASRRDHIFCRPQVFL